MSNPVELPNSLIAGGFSGKMIASLIAENFPAARAITAWTVCSEPLRLPQSLSRPNDSPHFARVH